MTPDMSHIFRSVITEWHEEVSVKAEFVNDRPEVLFVVKSSTGPERMSAGIDLNQAAYIRDGLTYILDKFKEAGYTA